MTRDNPFGFRASDFFRISSFGFRISNRLSDRLELSACCGAPDDPVAVVEPVQVMRVEPVAEIRPKSNRPGRRRAADAARNGAETVGVFPRRFGAALQFTDGHLRRAEHGVLAVVELP